MAIVIADQPEILALAQLSAVPASKIAAAFGDPPQFFEHLTLEELGRIQGACERFAALQQQMVTAMDIYTEAAQDILARVPHAD